MRRTKDEEEEPESRTSADVDRLASLRRAASTAVLPQCNWPTTRTAIKCGRAGEKAITQNRNTHATNSGRPIMVDMRFVRVPTWSLHVHVHVLTDGAAVDVSASHGRLALHRWRHGRCDNCNSALGGGECNDQCSLRRRRQGMCTTRAQCMFCVYKRTIDFFNLDFSDSPNDVEQRKCPAPRTKEARYFSSYPKIKAVNHIGHS